MRFAAALLLAGLVSACGDEAETPVCGNGRVESGEACDDGNDDDTDGCLSACVFASCGDGFVQAGIEGCDDGNDDDGDACLSTCISATCGDGVIQAEVEQCDDGAANSDTGACTTACIPARCGDGKVQEGVEQCDDGNDDDADDCLSTCVAATCGDGIVHDGVEACDDGNDDDTDACLSTCVSATCGDGVVQADVEQCDDGTDNSDTGACTTMCEAATCGDGLVREGVEGCDLGEGNLEGAACLPGCIPATCGDGFILVGIEECDDADANSDTGACLLSCEIARCGDGHIRDGLEECDDGNEDDTDGCPTTCEPARCGDGFVQAEVEGCDLGDADNSDEPGALCRTDCQPARCGDGIEDPTEACDDGNAVDGDGCSATCVVEGDDCANPLVIAPSSTDFSVAGDTRPFGTGIDLDFCTAPSATNRDVVYSFTSPIAARWDVELAPSEDFDIVLGVLQQCAASPSPGDELACADGPAEGGTERLFFLADAGQTIYFVIDGFDDDIAQEGTFTLSGTATPVVADGQACGTGVGHCDEGLQCNVNTAICGPNICGDGIAAGAETCDDGNAVAGDGCGSGCTLEGDQCSSAGMLPILQDGTVRISGTTVGLSADYQSGCTENGASGLNGDLFFAFTSPTDAHWKFDIAASFNSVLAIQTMCGNNETNLACDNRMLTNGGDSVSATLGAGETVYILVDGYGNTVVNEGTFVLTGTSIPVAAVDAVCSDSVPCAPGSFCYGLSGTCFNTCGNGLLDAGSRESCDDGNQVAGDGCGANCVREAAFACPTPGAACHPIVCGDGKVDYPETCDDGGRVDGDGCSAMCQLEAIPLPAAGSDLVLRGRYTPSDSLWIHPNAVCNAASSYTARPYDVYAFVNDGATAATVDFEMNEFGRSSYMHTYAAPWDPADPTANCLTGSLNFVPAARGVTIGPGEMRIVVVSDFYETYTPYALTVRNAPVCNDGIWGNAEVCDPGDLVDGDGCSSACEVESGFTCDRASGACFQSACGDGLVGNGEACDDGNTIDDDLCNNQCQLNGDDCGNAAVITADPATNSFSVQSDTSTSGLAFNLSCNTTIPNSAGSPDRVYEFTAPIDGIWTFTAFASPAFNLYFDVQRICGDTDRSLVCDGSSTRSSIRTATIEMAAGETLFLVVDGYGFASATEPQHGPFTLSGTVAPFVGVGAACDPQGETNVCAAGSFCDSTGPSPTCVASVCGNGVLESGEECEDGNSDPADGCDACRITAVPLAEAGSSVVFRGSVDATDPTWAPPGATCNVATRNGDWHYDTHYVRNTGTATKTVDIVVTAFPAIGALIVYDLPWDPTQPTFNCEKVHLLATPQISNFEIRAGEARAIIVGTGTASTPTPGPYEIRVITEGVCGDGIWGDTEACDDGNSFDGDGCSATCTVEAGQTCSRTSQTCFPSSCGDGLVGNGEECDDGNAVDDDTCANDCTRNGDTCADVAKLRLTAADPSIRVTGSTTGLGANYSADCASTVLSGDLFYEFTAPVHGFWHFSVRGDPNFDTAIAVTTVCGDPTTERDCSETGGKGALDEASVEIDVGHTVFVVVDGYSTSSTRNEGTFTLDVDVTPIKKRNEPCDPAGVTDACVIGTSCDETTLLCLGAVCGNGVLESGEECDDGNVANGDACLDTCQLPAVALAEAGSALRFDDALLGDEATWSPPNSSCKVATRAGDWFYDAYVVRNTGSTDKTIDINLTTMVTTVLLFVYELPWDPAEQLVNCASGSSSTTPAILDVIVPPGEARVVVVSSGVASNPTPGPYTLSVTTEAVCGDGIFGNTEACDDGGILDGDGCSQNCEVEPTYTCTPAVGCFVSVCGDGLVGNGEDCDDGNLTDDDGCSSACMYQNTDCSAPGIITSTAADPSFSVIGNTAGNGNDFTLGCVASRSNDAVYEFTAPVTGRWTFGARGQGFNIALAVRTACMVSASELDCANVGGTSALDEVVADLTAGQTVFLVVDGFSTATLTHQGPFTLTGKVRPTRVMGDACDPAGTADACVTGARCDGSAATPICVGSVCGNGTLESGEQCDDDNTRSGDGCTADCRIEGATCAAPRVITVASDNTFSITGDTTGLDRHYAVGCAITDNSPEMHLRFTSPIAGRWKFTVLGTGFDTALAVTETCGDPQAQIACVETGASGSNPVDHDTVEVVLDANQTVFIVVDGYSTATTVHQGVFTLTGEVTPLRQVGETCDPQAVADVCIFGSQCDLVGGTCVATVCGNGILQPEGGEECDDGTSNGPDAACSTDCKVRGDDCSAPFDLRAANTSQTAGSLQIAGSTDGFTNKHTPACFSEMIATTNHRDVVYQLTGNGTTDEYWEITLTGGSTSDLILDIASDCVARNARIFCSPDVNNANPATTTFHLAANETVFVWVDSEVATVQNYTLTGTWQVAQQLGGSCNPFSAFDGCARGLVCGHSDQQCIPTQCGDGQVTSDEECDEGPLGGNGCTADCYREGDTCNAPFDLNVVGNVNASGAWRHAGDISTMSPDYIPYCETAAGYNDVVYVFTPPVTGTYTFAETEAFDAVLYASSACPATSDRPDLACTPNESLVLPLEAGRAVFLFVERNGSSTQGIPASNTNYVFEASWSP